MILLLMSFLFNLNPVLPNPVDPPPEPKENPLPAVDVLVPPNNDPPVAAAAVVAAAGAPKLNPEFQVRVSELEPGVPMLPFLRGRITLPIKGRCRASIGWYSTSVADSGVASTWPTWVGNWAVCSVLPSRPFSFRGGIRQGGCPIPALLMCRPF